MEKRKGNSKIISITRQRVLRTTHTARICRKSIKTKKRRSPHLDQTAPNVGVGNVARRPPADPDNNTFEISNENKAKHIFQNDHCRRIPADWSKQCIGTG
jgi:hypothetical protein